MSGYFDPDRKAERKSRREVKRKKAYDKTMQGSWELYLARVEAEWAELGKLIARLNDADDPEFGGLNYGDRLERYIVGLNATSDIPRDAIEKRIATAQREIVNFRLGQVRDLLREGKQLEAADVLDKVRIR